MNKKINVLYIETGQLGGGSFESLLEIIKNLDREKFTPVVIFFTPNRIFSTLKDMGVSCYVLQDHLLSKDANKFLLLFLGKLTALILTFFPKVSVYWLHIAHYKTIKKLSDIIKKYQINIIHPNNQATRHFFSFIVAKKNNIPCISHLRSPNVERFNSTMANYANNCVYKFLVIFGDIEKVWLRAGLSKEKMIMLYNGITPFSANKIDLHQKYQIPLDKDFILGGIGRIIPQRGYDFMLQGFAEVLKNVPTAFLLIIGPGEEEKRLELVNLAKKLKIFDCVLFVGFEKNAKDIIASLDILILSYRQSPFGRTLLEAWQTKTVTVITNVAPIEKVVENNKDSLLVPFGDIQALSLSIVNLYKDKGLRENLIKNAFEKCNNYFHMEKYVQKLQNLYIEIVNGK